VIKFVSDLRQVGGFFWVLPFPPPIKTDHTDITERLLKVALNTNNPNPNRFIGEGIQSTWTNALTCRYCDCLIVLLVKEIVVTSKYHCPAVDTNVHDKTYHIML